MAETNANPFAAYDIAVKLRECIEPYLAMTTNGLPPRRCIHVGQIAWDDCECGQLIIAIGDGGEVDTFPEVTTARTRRGCGPGMFTWSMMVSMLRCAPTVGDNGEPPTCDELEEAARVSVEDAWAVRAGIICCAQELTKTRLPNGSTYIVDFTLGRQTFVGPMGLCQGSELPITIAMKNGCYPCTES